MAKQSDQIPLVSVKMITYGHEAYIRQAIEGVLMQETDFEYDLIVSDDCSPDKTNSIVKDIINTHSFGFRIKYFRHEKNLGMLGNGLFGLSKCTGKYIALCEGDDYWIDPLKLQKQVKFLEANPEYSICFTDYSIVHFKGEMIKKSKLVAEAKRTLNQEDLIIRHGIQALTAVFRNVFLEHNTEMKFINGDITLFAYLANFGNAGYLDIISGCYRISPSGVYSLKPEDYKIRVRKGMYTNLLIYNLTSKNNKKILVKQIQRLNFSLFYNSFFSNKRHIEGLKILVKSVFFELRFFRFDFTLILLKKVYHKVVNIYKIKRIYEGFGTAFSKYNNSKL